MEFVRGSGGRTARAQLLHAATALALLCACGLACLPSAHAQDFEGFAENANRGDGQMLLEADTLIYDNDGQTVTASGGVKVDYNGNRMVADEIVYNQRTGRLLARGNVAIVDPQGTKVFSDEIDVTDDFKDGFVNALRVETTDKTYFAAESAERRGGTLTTFVNGVYTACEPCEEKPDKPPIWRIKSRKIIWNGDTRIVRFERPTFEFFGFPIASFPAFEMADPTIKRKSGFLFPGIGYKSELGAKLSVPYFFALSPTYDLTVTATGFTRQGFLGEAEWRQKFDNGQYNLKIAGIRQNEPSAFRATYVDSMVRTRWMVGTKGDFKINPRWAFGWDILEQSDPNFSHTYAIEGFNRYVKVDRIYLTGLNDRNYFDLNFYRFNLQETLPRSSPSARDPLQPWVLPSIDYSYTLGDPVAGGELGFDVNVQAVRRTRQHFNPGAPALRGIDGWSGRLTAETEWKRNFVAPGGIVVTPILHARADGIGVDATNQSNAAIATTAGSLSGAGYTHDGSAYGAVAADIRSSYYRAMATAGLEARWPVLFSTASATHVLEPIAQIFARPDAAYQSTLGIPNEDAQSMVFDASSLFERDKFSGWDRIEGGTRANLGLRYSGSFATGWTAGALVGQSYHLAGDNPYASPDLVSAGAFSGLETDVSDVVAMVSVGSPGFVTWTAGGRFDEETFETRRAETRLTVEALNSRVTAGYAFIQAQPLYGFANNRREVTLSGRTNFTENWSMFAAGAYDIESETMVRSSVGFAYGDECFDYSMTFVRTENTGNKDVDYSVGFTISFRTIGDFGTSSSTFETN